MEHSNEFLAAMYGAHLDCKASIPSIDSSLFDLKGVNSYLGRILLCGDYSGGTHNVYQLDWWDVDSGEFKLALTPLSGITDEHAIEVAKILISGDCDFIGFDRSIKPLPSFSFKDEGIIYRLSTNVVNISIDIYKKGSHVNSDPPACLFIKAYDYLRSLGYDCGFRDIPSLIEAGIAIDKTTLNK